MFRCRLLVITVFLGLGISDLLMGAQLLLKERMLRSYLRSGVPQFDKAFLQKSEAEAAQSLYNDQFATGLFYAADVAESDDPRESIWSKQHSIGVKQALPWGVKGGLSYVYRNERFGAFFPPPYGLTEYHLPYLALSLEVDLWKNVIGTQDRVKEDYLKSIVNQSTINKKLQDNQLYNTLRGLYWRIVAQDRRIQIFRELVNTAKRSYRNMLSRQRDSIADKGAVAEMAANLSSAEANYRKSRIDRNFLERDLKILVPSLQPYDLRMADSYAQVRRAVDESVQCSKKVGRMSSIPYDFTEYDELIRKIDQTLQFKKQELDNHAAPDVSLSLVGRSFGLSQEFSEAAEQPFGSDKTAYSAVLSLNVPIGSPYRTEKQLINNESLGAAIQRTQLAARYKAAHSNLQKNFTPLAEAVKLYHKSIYDQEEAFKSTQRKFRQGRISVFDFIGSQNTLLNSKLQVIGLEERLILEMLDYFNIFNLAPCSFNRK